MGRWMDGCIDGWVGGWVNGVLADENIGKKSDR